MPNEVVEALRQYSWLGNVRELENVIGRAAIIASGPTLQLPDGWNREGKNGGLKSNGGVRANSEIANSLREIEKYHILDILHQTNWRIEGPKGAALILGVHPNTLRSGLSKFGIPKAFKSTKLCGRFYEIAWFVVLTDNFTACPSAFSICQQKLTTCQFPSGVSQ